MIVVLGSSLDPAAEALTEALTGGVRPRAVLLAAADLGLRGWAFDPARPLAGRLVAGGQVHPVSAVDAVVVRRPAVAPEELGWLHPADRSYGAAELNAFLLAWLAALPCPVLNRPGPVCLCGPGWSQLQWRHAVERVGLAWSEASGGPPGATRDVLACGARVADAADEQEASAVQALAASAGVELLGVRFADRAVAAVTAMPSLGGPRAAFVADALRRTRRAA